MQEVKEFEVETSKGAAVFVVPQLDGVRGTKLLVRLTKFLAPATKALASAKGEETNAARGMAAIGGVLAEVDPDEYERVQNEVLAKASARFPEDPEGPSTDDAAGKHLAVLFQGHAWALIKLVGEVLLFNYPEVAGLLTGKTAPK